MNTNLKVGQMVKFNHLPENSYLGLGVVYEIVDVDLQTQYVLFQSSPGRSVFIKEELLKESEFKVIH